MSFRLLIAGALTLLGLMLSNISQAQCNRYQWYGVESFVYFQVDAKTSLVIYGVAGHAYAAPTTGSGVSLAHMGASFAPTRWEIIHADPSNKSYPSSYMSANMRSTRRHDPCANPEFITAWNAGVFAFQFGSWDAPNSRFKYLDGGTFNVATNMATLNSFPGEWSIKVGRGESGVIDVVQFEKGFFYSVQDAAYATNGPTAFGNGTPGGDTWGLEPTKWGGGPVEGGDEGGIDADDLNDQNVNQGGFWQSLFQPSEEVWDSFVASMYELRHWGPFGYMTVFADLADDYSSEPDSYIIEFPTPFGALTMDAFPYSGFIVFFRHLAAGGLWFTVFMGVRARFIQKI